MAVVRPIVLVEKPLREYVLQRCKQDAEEGLKASTSAADAKEADIKKMEEAVTKHRWAPARSMHPIT